MTLRADDVSPTKCWHRSSVAQQPTFCQADRQSRGRPQHVALSSSSTSLQGGKGRMASCSTQYRCQSRRLRGAKALAASHTRPPLGTRTVHLYGLCPGGKARTPAKAQVPDSGGTTDTIPRDREHWGPSQLATTLSTFWRGRSRDRTENTARRGPDGLTGTPVLGLPGRGLCSPRAPGKVSVPAAERALGSRTPTAPYAEVPFTPRRAEISKEGEKHHFT